VASTAGIDLYRRNILLNYPIRIYGRSDVPLDYGNSVSVSELVNGLQDQARFTGPGRRHHIEHQDMMVIQQFPV
jgi:hypothetical protein